MTTSRSQGYNRNLFRLNRFFQHRRCITNPRILFRIQRLNHTKGEGSGEPPIRRPYRYRLHHNGTSHPSRDIRCLRSAHINASNFKLRAQGHLTIIINNIRPNMLICRTTRRAAIRQTMQRRASARFLTGHRRTIFFRHTIRRIVLTLCNHGQACLIHPTSNFDVSLTRTPIRCLSLPSGLTTYFNCSLSKHHEISTVLMRCTRHLRTRVTRKILTCTPSIYQNTILFNLRLRTIRRLIPRFKESRRTINVTFRNFTCRFFVLIMTVTFDHVRWNCAPFCHFIGRPSTNLFVKELTTIVIRPRTTRTRHQGNGNYLTTTRNALYTSYYRSY